MTTTTASASPSQDTGPMFKSGPLTSGRWRHNTPGNLNDCLWGMPESNKKLDARGRQLIGKLNPDAEVEIFLRLEFDPTSEQLDALQSAGCRLGSSAGNILTARVAVSRLEELAELPFVSSLQLSRELFREA